MLITTGCDAPAINVDEDHAREPSRWRGDLNAELEQAVIAGGPLTGKYRTAIDRHLRHGLTISRPDVARLMLTVLRQPETVRHAAGVAY